MDMKEEMMNDAVDDVIGDEEDDEERLPSWFIFVLLISILFNSPIIEGTTTLAICVTIFRFCYY